jgi:hypothetical protein
MDMRPPLETEEASKPECPGLLPDVRGQTTVHGVVVEAPSRQVAGITAGSPVPRLSPNSLPRGQGEALVSLHLQARAKGAAGVLFDMGTPAAPSSQHLATGRLDQHLRRFRRHIRHALRRGDYPRADLRVAASILLLLEAQ